MNILKARYGALIAIEKQLIRMYSALLLRWWLNLSLKNIGKQAYKRIYIWMGKTKAKQTDKQKQTNKQKKTKTMN